MKTTKAQRHYARFPVRWPIRYWNEELFGQGTVLEVSRDSCRVTGTMSVATGMVLKLWISPPQKDDPLCVEEARVLWVKDQEFWVELRRLPAIDRCELMGFLDHAGGHQHVQRVGESFKTQDMALTGGLASERGTSQDGND